MQARTCQICKNVITPLFRPPGATSITSTAKIIDSSIVVSVCNNCAHVQTENNIKVGQYYKDEYRFQTSSVEEDDLYEICGETRIYRSDQQARVVLSKINLDSAMKVLDYGCGKAPTLRKVTNRRPDLTPFVFDVSATYQALWDDFVSRKNQACFTIPPSWKEQMNVVLSFFALEHVESPNEFVANIAELLCEGGTLLVIIPDMRRNISDMLVADHLNHFSPSSLRLLLASNGFTSIDIDANSYRGAFVVTAIRSSSTAPEPVDAKEDVAAFVAGHQRTAQYWRDVSDRIRTAERQHPRQPSMIYGSGIYGIFIASVLQEKDNFRGFFDQNPFRQKLKVLDRPISFSRECAQ
jgi:SAM-dependent methyltransferase